MSILNILEVISVAGFLLQTSGSLFEVDILELSESPRPGVGIFYTSKGLGRRMVKELGPETDTGNG